MKVIVFGSKATVQKLIASLAGREIELVSLCEVLEAITLLKQEKFDLVVVDGLAREAETTCRCIKEFGGVPIVLMIGREQPNWKEMQSLGIDGYIPHGASGAELSARLGAIVRRCSPARQVEKIGAWESSFPNTTKLR